MLRELKEEVYRANVTLIESGLVKTHVGKRKQNLQKGASRSY